MKEIKKGSLSVNRNLMRKQQRLVQNEFAAICYSGDYETRKKAAKLFKGVYSATSKMMRSER